MASKKTIPKDSTIATLPALAGLKRQEYIRRVVGNFYASGLDRKKAVVRIGTQGGGISPHYKLEYPETLSIVDMDDGKASDVQVSATYKIYHGANHEEMVAFEARQIHEDHWSTKTMTFAEVSQLLGISRTKAPPRSSTSGPEPA
jgi:hypothetical protein